MTWLVWTLAGAVAVAFIAGTRQAWQTHKEEMRQLRERHARSMFKCAKGELDALSEIANRNPTGFRRRRTNESPWDYARGLADWGGLNLKPWMPSFGRLHEHAHVTTTLNEHAHTSVHVTTTLNEWFTAVDGIVHRAGRLPLADGSSVMVLLCDQNVMVTTPIETHEVGYGPVLTCLACVTRPPD